MASALTLLLLVVAQPAPIDDLIRARAERAAAGDLVAADRILVELEAAALRESGDREDLTLASWSLLQEARIGLTIGSPEKIERAVFLASAAARLAPDLPAAHATVLSAQLARRPIEFSSLAGAAVSLLFSMFGGVPLANALADGAIGLIAAILAFSIAQLIKHGRAVGPWMALFALAPPLLELGVLIAASLVLAATYAHAGAQARRVSVIAWSLAAILPAAIERALAWTLHLDPSAHDALARSVLAPLSGALPAWSIAVITAAAAAIAVLAGPTAPEDRAPRTPLVLSILPGAADLAGDRPLRGAALFAAFAATLAAIYWLDGLLPDPRALGGALPGPIPKLFAAGAMITVLVFLSTQRPRAWR